MEFSLRPATEEDRTFLWALHEATMREHVEPVYGWDDAAQRAYFGHRFEPTLMEVIQVGGEDVGVVWIERRITDLFLAHLAVLPARQGQGIGAAVVRYLLGVAGARGFPLALRVLKGNLRARALYERLGLEVVGETDTHWEMLGWGGVTPSYGSR